jgi:outer membrane receptor protein involved in Fe transport
VINGDYYGLTGTSGAGARNHWAYTAELQVPILKTLLADVSARYDHYANHGGGAYGHLTYKLGMEFRPFDTLLLRANYGTAFRAPDMSYVFGGTSGIYQYGLTDYYRCDQYGGPLDQCPYYQTLAAYALHSGNPELKPITAKSYGGGMVWSPNSNLTLKADYYNVSIKNEVELQSTDQLLKQEAACRTGELPIDSSTCQAALAQVTRPPGSEASNLVDVQLYPINIANERVSGIIASGDYRIDMGRFGSLGLQAQYNVTLKHVFQQYPFDPVVDYLRDPFYSSEFKNIASASVTWNVGRWSSTLRGTRYGRTPNYYAQSSTAGYATPCITSDDGYRTCPGTVAPWMVYNASVTYDIADGLRISGIVNNVFDSSPPFDYTWTESPYYNRFNYNTYGRQYWIELDWKFGRR